MLCGSLAIFLKKKFLRISEKNGMITKAKND